MAALVVVAVCLAVLGGLALAGARRAVQRRRALRAFAAQHRWLWRGRDGEEVQRHRGAPFRPRGRCVATRSTSVLSGTWGGRPCTSLDLQTRSTASGSDGLPYVRRRWDAVLVVRLKVALPPVELYPRSPAGRLLHGGHRDPLARRYRVRGRGAGALLQPGAVAALLAGPPVHLRVAQDEVVCWERGRTDPEGLRRRLETVRALLDAVPLQVWCAQPVSAPAAPSAAGRRRGGP